MFYLSSRRKRALSPRDRNRAGRTTAVLAACLFAVTIIAPAAQAAGNCTAQLSIVNSWSGGYQAQVTVTGGTGGVNGWTVAFNVGSSTVSSAWSSTLPIGATGAVSASNLSWNAVLANGTSTSFGFNGNGAAPPTGAVSCNNGDTTTTTAPTTTTTRATTTTTRATTTTTRATTTTTTAPTTTTTRATTTTTRATTTTTTRATTTTTTRATTTTTRATTTTTRATTTTTRATTTTTSGSGACAATFTIANSWQGGYQAEVRVTANSSLTSWAVSMNLGSSTVTNGWNSTLAAGATGAVTARNAAHNGTVAAGSSVTFGFQATGPIPTPQPACSGTGSGSGTTQPPVNAPNNDDWLHVKGNQIVDAAGRPVWLTGANWFGFNASERVFHGLWSVNLYATLDSIAAHGINVLRVPISTQLLLEWRAGQAKVASGVNTYVNPELVGMTTLQVFDAFLTHSKRIGLKVILDVHSAEANNAGHFAPMWYDTGITTADFYVGWEWVANRYKNDDTIIGFDLQNEPHGKYNESPRAKWDNTTDVDNWKHAAETVAKRILAVHPNALILVEGIETYVKPGVSWSSRTATDYYNNWWGGNLRGVADHDLNLGSGQNRLVYSPHDYGPLVYNQPWFQGTFSMQSLINDVWMPNWLYIHENNMYPLLIGEWGGRLGEDARQDRWMTYLRDLIRIKKIHHTFWCINPNSGDTGGLLLDDWKTWDAQKMALLNSVLWQDRNGRFVSLDHVISLPGGTNVTEYYANGNAAPVG